MIIKVSINAATYKDSQYQVNSERNKLTYQQLIGRLIMDHIVEDSQSAEERISNVWLDHQTQASTSEEKDKAHDAAIRGLKLLTSHCPSISRRLSQEAVELLSQYMGWSADSRGVFQWFYRLNTPARS